MICAWVPCNMACLSLQSVQAHRGTDEPRKEGSKECFNILSDLSANNEAVAFQNLKRKTKAGSP